MKDFDWKLGRPLIKNFESNTIENVISDAKHRIGNQQLFKIFSQTFPNTLDTTVNYELKDGKHDTYVITGDIDAMWLRDSTAQVWQYLPLMTKDKAIQNLVAGVINRQAHYVRVDPYANAFNYGNEGSIWESDFTKMLPELHERKWEIDSLCYHIRLAYQYWQITGDGNIFDKGWLQTATKIYDTFIEQQLKDGTNPYTFQRNTPIATDTLADNGLGNRVNPVGLIASSFRPSDDATILPFLIPSNYFAANVLSKLAEIVSTFYKTSDLGIKAKLLANEVLDAIKEHAIVKHKKYGEIIAYEVDGFGSHLLMDDANVPSLLSLPYLGCIDADSELYINTRNFILSTDNPWFFAGSAISGVGSIHTGRNKVWSISVTMQALTSNSEDEINKCLEMLINSHNETYFMHEGINKDNQSDYSRPWFAWANSLFSELVIKQFLSHDYCETR